MDSEAAKLVDEAKEILENNWTGKYTQPSPLLYPHQWSWDSAFIAIGYSTFNQERAQTELASLFEAQWRNGMVPQIVFNSEVTGEYFPDPEFWDSSISPHAPKDYRTSGITQPPVHAIAALYIYERAKDKKSAREFLAEMYPKLVASHRFFYEYRDADGSGLAYIRHPWESGTDNSPIWDAPLSKIAAADIPTYARRDLDQGISAEQRPSDQDYDRYVYLVELYKKHRHDEDLIRKNCPFLIEDVLVNSILVKANEDLVRIGAILGADTSLIKEWENKTKKAINSRLWHSRHGFYDDFDLNAQETIEVDTAGGFSSLYAGVATKTRAQELYNYLDSKSFCAMHEKKCFSIPNYNKEGEYFNPANYWRGPIWININWMLFHGLRRYGFDDKADSVRNDIVELARRNGFYEYFDPITGKAYGSKDFSWSAALFLDCLYDQGVLETS